MASGKTIAKSTSDGRQEMNVFFVPQRTGNYIDWAQVTATKGEKLEARVTAIWALVRRTNQYLEERQPWMLAKRPEAAETLDTVLWSAAEATRQSALLLAP